MHQQAPTRVAKRQQWSWALALAVLALGAMMRASAAPDSVRDRAQKDKAGQEEGKKDDVKKPAPKEPPGVDIPFPNFDMIFKNLPAGALDPAQMEKMKKEMQKMMEEMRKRFPGGAFPPGMFPGGFGGFGPGMMQAFGMEGRLGARVEKPSEVLIEQLDLPKNQGLVIRDVRPESAAAKAGIKANDILLEIDGKPVPQDVTDLVKQLQTVKAGAAVDAVVLRKGKKESIKGITLPEAKAPAFPAPGAFPPGAFPGAPFPGAQFPGFPPGFPGAFPGAADKGVMTTVNRTDDKINIMHRDGKLKINIQATVADGKTKVGNIQVQDSEGTTRYESIDRVPEMHRDLVRSLIELGSKTGGGKH